MDDLTILWLDDIRDPNKYFFKKNSSNAFQTNKKYYDNLFKNNSVNFIWVKNFDEFKHYILKNGLPQFISFDHDLGAGLEKGLDCAKWLTNYCKMVNKPLPQFYVHSANKNGRIEINKLLNNFFLNESVMDGRIWTIDRIRQNFKTTRGVNFSRKTITHFATKLGYRLKCVGGLIGYDKSLYGALTTHFNELVEYDKASKVKRFQKPLKREIDYNPDKFIEPEDRKDYAWESKIPKYIIEAVDELELFHGSPHDFKQFDFAYMSSGWGQQAYGYGGYLTTEYECAKEYSKGGNVYTVEIPDRKYLNYDKISPSTAIKITRAFFNYYMKEDEYGREAYAGHERDFWEYECKYLADCYDGGSIYGTIASFLGNDKSTSQFLHDKLGYKGLVWVATNGNTGKKFKNYVIFDAKDIKILKKERT